MICFHGYGGNYQITTDLKKSGLIDATLVSFNFPDHDLQEKSYDPHKASFGTIQELLPALYVLKKCIIDEAMDSIDLYGRSAGGGVLINLIATLNSDRFNSELQQIGIETAEKKRLLNAIQNGLVILDVPLKSVEEIIAFRGSNTELEILAEHYRDNHMRPLDAVALLHGLSLNIIIHFQDPDEIMSNRDDKIYIEKINVVNQLGTTAVIIGNDGGHQTVHQSLWQFYSEKLAEYSTCSLVSAKL